VRAMETARIVAAPHALEVAAEPRLREFDFGDWEGLTWPQIVATRPHLEDGARTAAALYAPDGGETFEAVCARVSSFFADLRANPAGHVAVVMHAGPLHAALAVLGLVPQAADGSTLAANFAPASLTRIAMEAGRSRLITLSDVRHLHTAG
jgi:broad specificity phosphatase PhoE